MRRRRLVLGAGAVVVTLAAGVSGVAWRGIGDGGRADGGGDGPGNPSYPTATIARRDLEQRARLTGTLGHGPVRQVSPGSAGTITALPELGTVVDRGQTLLEVDGAPVLLLFGERPPWRLLEPGVGDGADVEQLEANLVALGFATSSSLTVDRRWTAATTNAVKAWQRSLGRDETGVVPLGATAVLPGAVRVVGHPTPLGGPAGGPVVEVTGTTRLVTVDLAASRQSLVSVGQAVQVELPDRTVTPGRVATVGRVAQHQDAAGDVPGGSGGEATIEVTISLDDPVAAESLDEAPVAVLVVTQTASDVLTVPVVALLALAEGGFAVERVEPSGGTRLVGVETGAFADGWVQVTSDNLAEGDDVVVPE